MTAFEIAAPSALRAAGSLQAGGMVTKPGQGTVVQDLRRAAQQGALGPPGTRGEDCQAASGGLEDIHSVTMK